MAWHTGLWAGLGLEVACEVGIGVSRHEGILMSMDDAVLRPKNIRRMIIRQDAVSFGLSLGGAAGGNFLLGLNGHTPMDFDGASDSYDFSLDLGWGGLGKYLRSAPELIELAAIARKFDGRLMSLAENLTKYEKNVFFVKDASEGILKNLGGLLDTKDNKPAIIALPLPGSMGLRVSLKMKLETTDVFPYGSMDIVL